MKHIALTDFLTPDEVDRAAALWQELRDTGRFAATVARDIITPNMPRINETLGQENDARYLAYAVEYVFSELDTQTPGHLWDVTDDRCKVCHTLIGHGLRFLHVGLCDTCAAAPKH